MPVRNIAKVERFFRASSGLDIDKSDVKRYEDFVNRKNFASRRSRRSSALACLGASRCEGPGRMACPRSASSVACSTAWSSGTAG